MVLIINIVCFLESIRVVLYGNRDPNPSQVGIPIVCKHGANAPITIKQSIFTDTLLLSGLWPLWCGYWPNYLFLEYLK